MFDYEIRRIPIDQADLYLSDDDHEVWIGDAQLLTLRLRPAGRVGCAFDFDKMKTIQIIFEDDATATLISIS